MPNPAEIAAKLTRAQRAAVLWCNADGSPREWEKGGEVSFFCLAKVIIGDPEREAATIYSLTVRGDSKTQKRGLWPNPTWALTPLGLAVRAHLEKNDDRS